MSYYSNNKGNNVRFEQDYNSNQNNQNFNQQLRNSSHDLYNKNNYMSNDDRRYQTQNPSYASDAYRNSRSNTRLDMMDDRNGYPSQSPNRSRRQSATYNSTYQGDLRNSSYRQGTDPRNKNSRQMGRSQNLQTDYEIIEDFSGSETYSHDADDRDDEHGDDKHIMGLPGLMIDQHDKGIRYLEPKYQGLYSYNLKEKTDYRIFRSEKLPTKRVLLEFINKSRMKLNISWIDYEGIEDHKFKFKLRRNAVRAQETYTN